MRINHNLAALNTIRQLGINSTNTQKALEKLSSGLRINSAADDAAGLAISEKMRGQISGLEQAQRNAQDGISLISTAEGALNETHSILQRMRELAVQSSNDTNTTDDRKQLQKEMDQLSQEITRISSDTQFNGKNLLDGSFTGKFQIGANEGQNITLSVDKMDSDTLGVSGAEGVKMAVTSTATVSSQDADGSATNTDAAENFGALSSTAGGAAPTSSFDVVQLDKEVTITDGSNTVDAKYALKDSSGNVVAVSNDGSSYTILEAATAESSLSSSTGLLDDGTNTKTIDFGANTTVTSGTVTATFTANDTSNAVDTLSFKASDGVVNFASGANLSSGTYTVVDSSTSYVSSGYGLLDSNNNLIATSTDGQDWNDMFGKDLFNVDASADALTANGTKLTVASSGGIDISTQDSADKAITVIDNAINTVSTQRSGLGAYQNRLEHTINNLGTSSQNLTAAESRIRDVDYALAA